MRAQYTTISPHPYMYVSPSTAYYAYVKYLCPRIQKVLILYLFQKDAFWAFSDLRCRSTSECQTQ